MKRQFVHVPKAQANKLSEQAPPASNSQSTNSTKPGQPSKSGLLSGYNHSLSNAPQAPMGLKPGSADQVKQQSPGVRHYPVTEPGVGSQNFSNGGRPSYAGGVQPGPNSTNSTIPGGQYSPFQPSAPTAQPFAAPDNTRFSQGPTSFQSDQPLRPAGISGNPTGAPINAPRITGNLNPPGNAPRITGNLNKPDGLSGSTGGPWGSSPYYTRSGSGSLQEPATGVIPAPVNYRNTGNLASGNARPGLSTGPYSGSLHPNGMPPMGPASYNGPVGPVSPMSRSGSLYGNGARPPVTTKYKRRFPIWSRVLVGILLFFVLVGGTGLAYYKIAIEPSLNNILNKKAVLYDKNGHEQQNLTSNSALNNQNRINILLLGSDNDGKNGNDKTPLAQTDMIITIDKQANYVGMLSIPRDLQITIPGYEQNKMDFAFSYGNQAAANKDKDVRVGSGAGLAIKSILRNYGIKIDRYAWVGLDGFVKVINTVGGVDVDVLHPMVDDSYPDDVNSNNANGYKRLYIAPGPQHLDGPHALEYVRTRHSDLAADFGRTQRQQQILTALKTKLATPDVINKIPDLLKDVQGYLYTDMSTDDLVTLGNLARSIDLNKLDRVTLSPPMYSHPSQYSTNTNYYPNCDQIIPKLTQMFNIQANCISQTDHP